jgi:hypothetical protein
MVSKKGATPASRFVDQQIEVPNFQTIEEAQAFLAALSQRAGAGELELQSALDVSTLVKNWILSRQGSEELALKQLAAGEHNGEQRIIISGGLPDLPGCNITMLQLNGHPALDHTPAIPSPGDVPAQAPVEGAPPATPTNQGP